MSTVQDHPGRLGYWAVGVPPSGPMDDLSFRIGNRLVGNADGAAGLELTAQGPRLLFHAGRDRVPRGRAVRGRRRRSSRCRCGSRSTIGAGATS